MLVADPRLATALAPWTGSVLERVRSMSPALVAKLKVGGSFRRVRRQVGAATIPGLAPAPGRDAEPASPPPARVAGPAGPGRPEALDLFFPVSPGEPFVVEGQGVRVVYRKLGAAGAPAREAEGQLVYAGAYRDTDILHTASRDSTEELLWLGSPDAPTQFEYEIAESGPATTVAVDGGAVYFTNAAHEGLVLSPPVVLDSDGRRSPTAGRWELSGADPDGKRRLTLKLDPHDLTYPLVIDPGWTTTGSLTSGRANLAAILLHTGNVLVVSGLSSVELYDPATGRWASAAPVPVTKGYVTATLLPSGRVLVAGGTVDWSNAVRTCYLYDPLTDTWSPTGSLNTARMFHSATLLRDGRVLVAGGENPLNTGLSSAEIYDPTTGTWNATGSMAGARAEHTATRLNDGRVLVAAGDSPTVLRTAELFDPSTDAWTPTGDLSQIRTEHSATLLPDGNVLAVGDAFDPTTPEVYDVSSGAWSLAADSIQDRGEHTATLLPNGKVLLAGGYFFGAGVRAGTETYDYRTNTWASAGNLATARFIHAAVLLPTGKVLVVGGSNGGAVATAEVYDPDVGTWSATANMNQARVGHTATLLRDGRVLVAGDTSAPASSTAELYTPGAGWTPTGNLVLDRGRYAATLLRDGRVLVAGGGRDPAEVYDPGSGAWTATGALGRAPRYHTATLLPCGEVLVAGGQTSDEHREASLYNPDTGRFRATGDMTSQRAYHTATLLGDGRVLVTGGWDGGPLASAELYDPTSGQWTATASLAVARSRHTATLLPNGRVLVTGGWNGVSLASAQLYDPVTGSWSPAAAMATPRDTHSAVLLPNGRVLVSGGWGGAPLASSELYDPETNRWLATAAMTVTREEHRATLLLDGRVLVSGGAGPLSSSEIYDVGRGEDPAWRPTLAGATDPLVEGGVLAAAGAGFRGISEASTGNNVRQSATDYPLVQLTRVDNEASRWLPVAAASGWSDTSFTSPALTGLQPGPARVTVFTNGIPSVSRTISVECPPPAITSQPQPRVLCAGGSASFTVAASGHCPSFRWRKGGVALAEGGHYSGTATAILTVSNVDAGDVDSYDAVASLPCTSSTTASLAATLTLTVPLSGVTIASTAPTTVCLTCTGGTVSESHSGGGPVIHQWGFRTAPAGPITDIRGQTGPTYIINGADFPGAGTYFLVLSLTPAAPSCGGSQVSNDLVVNVNDTLPADTVQFMTITSKSGENRLEWLNPAGTGDVRIHVTSGPTSCTFPSDPLAAGTLLADVPGTVGLRNSYTHLGLNDTWKYCYTVFADQGGTYSAGRSNRGRPFDSSGRVKWAYSTGFTAVTAPGLGSVVLAVSNDRVLHGMVRGGGLTGGYWPPDPFIPFVMDGSAQTRPPVLPGSILPPSVELTLLGSQDGHVYAVDTASGAQRWQSPLLGDRVQAGAGALLQAFGGAYDYVLVGTWNPASDNAFHALRLADGTIVNSFDNGGGAGGIGVISGTAAINYTASRAYFASRTRGSPGTLWCVTLGASGIGGLCPEPDWPVALGDIDGSPTLRGGRIYVGNNAGLVYAVDASTGVTEWSFDTLTGEPVKGFVFPDRSILRLFFSTTTRVFGISDLGGAAGLDWQVTLGASVTPSIALYAPGTTHVYVGGSDGRLHQIDFSPPTPAVSSVVLGDGAAVVGAATLNRIDGFIYVGTDAGIIYAIQSPL